MTTTATRTRTRRDGLNLSRKLLKYANTLYLYGDGHAVVLHSKRDKDAGTVEWVTIHRHIGIRTAFDGRVIFRLDKYYRHDVLLRTVDTVTAREGNDAGSSKTREAGIFVQTVTLGLTKGGHLSINLIPNYLAGSFDYQSNVRETWDDVKDAYSWGHGNKINRDDSTGLNDDA